MIEGCYRFRENAVLLLDNRAGLLYINPSDELKASYQTAVQRSVAETGYKIPDRSVTADGTVLKIQANINIIHDIDAAREVKADGIGLYRSEFPFLVRNEFPSEEAQLRIYQKILNKNGDSECVFRTLDIGGDKMPGYSSFKTESNPFLGFRGNQIFFRLP